MPRTLPRRRILVTMLAVPVLGPAAIRVLAQDATPVPVRRYDVTDLGTLGGGFSMGNGINRSGQVAGGSDTAEGTSRAFLWSDGTLTDLGTLGGDSSWSGDLNDAGQVVGDSDTADGTTRAFLWDGGEMIDLGTLGGDHSSAIRINEAGQVVGHATTAPGQELLDPGTHAFLWDNGEMIDLGTLDSDFSRATSINEAGQVVGTSETAEGAIHPFLWTDGEMGDLGTLPGFGGGRAVDMNDAGHVVGFAVDPLPDSLATPVAGPPLARHAWLSRDGELIDLGTLGGTNSSALGINADGLVVGWADIPLEHSLAQATPVVNFGVSTGPDDAPAPRAFVWENGVMSDLNALSSGDELVLETAFGIGDAGHIVGGAVVGDEYHAFLLTPAPSGTATSSMPGWAGSTVGRAY